MSEGDLHTNHTLRTGLMSLVTGVSGDGPGLSIHGTAAPAEHPIVPKSEWSGWQFCMVIGIHSGFLDYGCPALQLFNCPLNGANEANWCAVTRLMARRYDRVRKKQEFHAP